MITRLSPLPSRSRSTRVGLALAAVVVAVLGGVVDPSGATPAPVPDRASTAPSSVAARAADATAARNADLAARADAAAPLTGVAAAALSPTEVALTWTAPSSGGPVVVCRAAGRRSGVVAQGCAVVGTVDAMQARFVDVVARPGLQYTYAVARGDRSAASTARWAATVRTPRVVRGVRSTGHTTDAVVPMGPPPHAPDPTSSIAGHVTLSGGAAAPGATVSLIGYDWQAEQNFVAATTSTDSSGGYSFSGVGTLLGDADAAVCVNGLTVPGAPSPGGYVSTCYGGDPWDRLPADASFRTSLGFSVGGSLTAVDLVLVRGVSIGGTVTAAGAKVVGASVIATTTGLRAVTGSDGSYRLDGVPAGVSPLCVDATTATTPSGSPGYASQCWSGQPWDLGSVSSNAKALTLTVGSTRFAASFALGTGGGLAGTVTAAGKPVAGADVYIARPPDPTVTGQQLAFTGPSAQPSATTDAAGAWRVAGLAPGAYLACVDASHAGVAAPGVSSSCGGGTPFVLPGSYGTPADAPSSTVTAGALTTVATTLTAGAGVVGVVRTKASQPLGGVVVGAFGVAGSGVSAQTTTAADGTYSLTGLRPGSYSVCFDARGATGSGQVPGYLGSCWHGVTWNGASAVPATATPVTLAAGSSVTISPVLSAAGAVTGTVTDTAGSAVAGASVSVLSAAGYSGGGGSATTSADGSFSVAGLSGGAYTVCDYGVTGATTNCATANVTVTAGATTSGVTIVEPVTGSVGGTVADPQGRPVSDASVIAFDATGTDVGDGVTTPDGRWRLDGVPVVPVTVCVDGSYADGVGSASGFAAECWNNVAWGGYSTAVPAGTTTVTPAAGSAAPQEAFVLSPAAAVAGTVVRSSGTAVAGVGVVVVGSTGNQVGWATTANDGTFTAGLGGVSGGVRVCVAGGATAGRPNGTGTLGACYGSGTWNGSTTTVPISATVFTPAAGTTAAAGKLTVMLGGAVGGTVVTDSGTPLPGASVVAFSGGSWTGSTVTSADGSYLLPALAAGSFGLCASTQTALAAGSTGWQPRCRGGVAWTGSFFAPPPGGVTPTTVTGGATTSGVALTLTAGAAVHGTIRDASSGLSPASAFVSLFDPSGRSLGGISATADGSWRVTGLPAGNVVVCASGYGPAAPAGYVGQCTGPVDFGGTTPPSGATALALAVGTDTAADLALPRGSGIGGVVTDSATSPKPVSGASVVAFDSTGARVGTPGYSAYPTGAFTVTGLRAGTYTVCVNAAGATGANAAGYRSSCWKGVAWDPTVLGLPSGTTPVNVASGALAGPLAVRLTPSGGIAGTVTDATTGTGLAYAMVSATDGTGRTVGYGYSTSTGAWTITGLVSGSYGVCVSSLQTGGPSSTGYVKQCWKRISYSGYAPPSGTTSVAVKNGAVTTGITFPLARAGGVSGTVTDAASGRPVSGVRIRVFSTSNTFGGYVNNYYDSTANDGTYTVTGLAAGSYIVCFDASAGQATGSSSGSGWFNQCWKNTAWAASSYSPPTSGTTAVTVKSGATTSGVNAALAASAAIAGRVTGADGSVQNGASVRVYSGGMQYPIASAQTDSTGAYLVPGLTAGSYQVCFAPPYGGTGAGYLPQCYQGVAWTDNGSGPAAGAATVTTTGGAVTSGIDAALAPGAGLSVAVTDSSGTALRNANVLLYQGGNLVGSVTTYGGPAAFSGLNPGSYTVCVQGSSASGDSSNGGYRSACYANVAWDGVSVPPTGTTAVALTTGSTASVTMALAAGSALGGTATSNGQPVRGVIVQVFGASGAQIGSVSSSYTDGTWSLGGLPAGSYRVCATGFANGVTYSGACYKGVSWSSPANGPDPAATAVATTVGSTVGGVDLALTAGG